MTDEQLREYLNNAEGDYEKAAALVALALLPGQPVETAVHAACELFRPYRRLDEQYVLELVDERLDTVGQGA